MFKVKAINLYEALERVAVGGGECYVIAVDPTPMKIGENQTVQVASISTSDGEKTGITSIQIHCIDMDKPEIYYATANIKAAVSSLSKITDMLIVESKGSHLLVSDEKKESVIKVELKEQDKLLELPGTPEGAVLVTMKRENFVNSIRLGGYSAVESNRAGTENINFLVDVKNKRLVTMSMRNSSMCKAEASIEDAKSMAEKENEWHLINYKFIQSMNKKLSGDLIQIAFTPKFMMVVTKDTRYGCKKSEGMQPVSYMKVFENKESLYSGTIDKKDLMLGMEIAMVGVTDNNILLEGNDNGTLNVLSKSSGNKSSVLQKKYEGKMPQKMVYFDILKQVLGGIGDEVHYYGVVTKDGGNTKEFVRFDGIDSGVQYESILLPISYKK